MALPPLPVDSPRATDEPFAPLSGRDAMRRAEEAYGEATRLHAEARELDQAMSAVARSGRPVAGPVHPLTGQPWDFAGLTLGDLRERRNERRTKAEEAQSNAGAEPAVLTPSASDREANDVHPAGGLDRLLKVPRPPTKNPNSVPISPPAAPDARRRPKEPPPPVAPTPGLIDGPDDPLKEAYEQLRDLRRRAVVVPGSERTDVFDGVVRKTFEEVLSSIGDAKTVRGNEILMERCLDMARKRYPALAHLVANHVEELNKIDNTPNRKEVKIYQGKFHDSSKGHSRPDLIISIGRYLFFINTQTMKANQVDAIKREVDSLETLRKNVGDRWVVDHFRKMLDTEYKGGRIADYEREADEVCKRIFEEGEERDADLRRQRR